MHSYHCYSVVNV